MRIFRGKIKENNEWVYGVPLQKNDNFYIVEDLFLCDEYDCIGTISYNVFGDSIGQSSTVKDKNGIDMFEGDIVAGALWWLEQPKYGIVTFRDGSFGLLWYRGKAEQFNPFTSMCNVQYEVVGNIVDNKDFYESEVLTNE